MILIDTSVLSRVFRRRRPGPSEVRVRAVVEGLLRADIPLGLPSTVLQELLSGLRAEDEFNDLHERLRAAFTIVQPSLEDHIEAARLRNVCLTKGVNASGADCLIAALAIAGGHELYTADRDFTLLARHSKLRLFDAEADSA